MGIVTMYAKACEDTLRRYTFQPKLDGAFGRFTAQGVTSKVILPLRMQAKRCSPFFHLFSTAFQQIKIKKQEQR